MTEKKTKKKDIELFLGADSATASSHASLRSVARYAWNGA